MSDLQTVSYDKIDPLENEKPFFVSENGKVYQIVQKREKKFPTFHVILFGIAIPLVTLIMGMIYIGGIWNPVEKVTELNYVIVNSDKGCYTPICAKMGLDEKTNIGNYYSLLDGKGGHFTMINGDRQKALDMIENHDYWAALYVPENFTSDILLNLNAVNKYTLVPVNVDFIYDEVRSYTTINFVKKAFNIMERAFFNTLVKKFDDKGSFNPLFLIDGINYKDVNIHPISGFGQNFATFIFLVIVWIGTIATSIISHFYFPFEDHWLLKKDTKHPILKAMIAKIIFCGAIMIVIDVICSVIPFFCGGKFEIQKGYWAFLGFILFFSLSGLGINNLLIHILPFIFFYLIAVTFMFLQLLSCGGLVDNDIQYDFFKIGRAFPMYYGVKEIRYIYWKSGHQYQGKNCLIIALWAAVTIIASIFMYYLELKVKRRRWLKNNKFLQEKNEKQ
ncbi:hypothetical protein H8356DRAFT_1618121 [Neocallimastix lanati (nom. inval.)]|jgi:uncharacterized phage infection (PIP) family protein YhgE|nr:hypothetical protein H8356DRAFT_1618121 [Neocallimastix sp. JGI-2020a]